MGELYDKLEKGWSFVDLEPIKKGEDSIDRKAVPYITTPKAWEQYNNEILYQADKKLREFVTEMRETDPTWATVRNKRKFTLGMLFRILFDREWDSKADAKNVYPLKKLFSYYSTRIQKNYYVGTKQKNKICYNLMANPCKKAPYSLRLRLEWLAEKGEIPNSYNMKMPVDNLTPGHARNKRTDANMEARRERARERYNKYQRERKQRLAEADSVQQTTSTDS